MCSSVASALEFGVWKVNTKASALMTVWSAARGAGRLSKRGHSFCLRSLAGPIQPPTPLQHPLSARSPHREREGEGSMPPSLSLSLLWPFCHQTESLNLLAAPRLIEPAALFTSCYLVCRFKKKARVLLSKPCSVRPKYKPNERDAEPQPNISLIRRGLKNITKLTDWAFTSWKDTLFPTEQHIEIFNQTFEW